jgi:hypothetical protein
MRKSSLQKSLLLHTQGVFKWLLLLGELHGGREFNLNQYEVISTFKLILKPSISSNSKPCTRSCTRLLNCFEYTVLQNKNIRDVLYKMLNKVLNEAWND